MKLTPDRASRKWELHPAEDQAGRALKRRSEDGSGDRAEKHSQTINPSTIQTPPIHIADSVSQDPAKSRSSHPARSSKLGISKLAGLHNSSDQRLKTSTTPSSLPPCE